MDDGHVKVVCGVCGRLGIYYVTPEQHMEGAMMRAQNLAMNHQHLCRIDTEGV
jgi:hypothetical protein